MAETRLRRALSLVGAGLLCLSFLGIAPAPASADEIGDKRAEAERIAAQVDSLNQRIEILAEEFDAAQDELSQVRAEQAAAQAKVDATKAEMAQREEELATYAVQAYVRGGDPGALPVLLRSDGTDIGQRQGYLSAAAGNRQQLLDNLAATRQDVELQVTQLDVAKAEAERVSASIEATRVATEAAASQQRALLARAQGELANLVRQEQERRAAADAAAARARAQAAGTRPPSGGGGDSTGGGGSTPPPNVNGGAAGAVAEAQRQLGVRYTWGGASPETGFDCSGLTMWAWQQGGGVSLPHSSTAQYSATTHIPISALQPGDLVFYGYPIHHVAIYVGGGQIIHSPHAGGVVQYDSLYYWDELVGAGRV